MKIHVIVGGLLKKDGKYLLVQEGEGRHIGKWNLPAGHLEPNETIFEGAKREIREESGYNSELKSILFIGNRVFEEDIFHVTIFNAEVTDYVGRLEDEIMDTKWLSYDEIMEMKVKDELRDHVLTTIAIEAAERGDNYDLDIIKIAERTDK